MTPAGYDQLLADVGGWDVSWDPADAATRAAAEALLYREARLLDEGRLDEWAALLTDDCLYWVPAGHGDSDPRRQVTLAFDDRRRLEDRLYWLQCGLSSAQRPPSRTRRAVTNVEVGWGRRADELRVRSTFVVYELRAGQARALAGSYAHLLRADGPTLRIAVKKVDLLDADRGHDNLTIVL